MARRARRILGIVAVLLAVQAALVAAYLLLTDDAPSHGLEAVPETRPALAWRTRSGEERQLADLRGRPVLLHVWATWCPPCRDELPGLLAWADEAPLEVVALTVDRDWDTVQGYLGGEVHPSVVRASSDDVTAALGTQALPETWVLDADGVARARLRGPGDWSSDALRQAVLDAARRR